MITYTEKGAGLHAAIRAAGHALREENGQWIASDEQAVQAIIDSYDPLPDYKTERIAAVKADGLTRIRVLFPAIQTFDDMQLIREQWLSVAAAARNPTAAWQKLIDTYTAGRTAITQISAAANKTAVDAVIPAWPVQ